MKTSRKKSTTMVLLDMHALLHRGFHALPEFATTTGFPTGALYGLLTMLLRIIDEFSPTYIVACYDLPDPTHRHTAFAEYKGTRSKTDNALITQIQRSYDLIRAFGIPVFEVAGYEADDMLGTIAYQLRDEPTIRVVIASGDMDTLQCVDGDRVVVYTLKKGLHDTVVYNEAAVLERFGFPPALVPDYKGLRGDTSDNIPGIKGIGEKTATTLLTRCGGLDAIYNTLKDNPEALKDAGLSPRLIELLKNGQDEAYFSKMLATIRTDAPITIDLALANWREQLDHTALETLLREFQFRSLWQRLEPILGRQQSVAVAPVSTTTLNTARILLWLTNSEATNADQETIMSYGEAHYGTTDISVICERLLADLPPRVRTVYDTLEVPLTPVLEAMTATGVLLDVPYLATLSKTMHEELGALETTITTLAGTTFNINSPKQLGNILFDTLGLGGTKLKKTATGQRSTKESELEKLKDDHPIIPAILRYRELQKLVSTYVDSLPTFVGEDGRVHTTFIQTGAATGRMATERPSVQNIPVRTEESRAIRRAFVASPGYTLVSIDYSQIELRIAAILSGDTELIDIFKRGEDVHSGVAMRVFGVGEHELTKDMRRQAKVINFGILYGMGVTALRTNLGQDTTREAAQQFYNAYFNTFTQLAQYLEETKTDAKTQGFTETLFGRRRHFPGIKSGPPFMRAMAERMAINAPVQGTAADMMRLAMIQIHEYCRTQDSMSAVRPLIQIHDELLFEIESSIVAQVIPELKAILESVLANFDTKGVPIIAEAAIGKNWGELAPWQKDT